jgi:Arc/MetJ-type ribon-helix-helix transcriptional regulator
MTFDYTESAELFMPKNGKAGLRQPLSYRRFASAAEAIRFAVEDFPAIQTLRAWMRVGDERFNGDDIRRLYESKSYPWRRRIRKLG